MGLGFSHCEAHWSYSGFNLFRTRLAGEIGITLKDMVGFGGSTPWPSADTEPIIHLLDHSDCEGDLSPKQCQVIALRLVELIADWEDGDYDKKQAIRLADGMAQAARKRQKLRFT